MPKRGNHQPSLPIAVPTLPEHVQTTLPLLEINTRHMLRLWRWKVSFTDGKNNMIWKPYALRS